MTTTQFVWVALDTKANFILGVFLSRQAALDAIEAEGCEGRVSCEPVIVK